MAQYDYVIVGGGTSGCVAAWNLVKQRKARVLVLEAGWSDDSWLLRMPAGFVKLLHGSRYLTFRESIPQEQLFGRTQIVPQGNVLGGGSTVNAQVYQRGRAADWDAWKAYTKSDLWSWETILPHFVRLEGNQKFNNEYHGVDGPLKVSDPSFICEMSHLYVRAVQELGFPLVTDLNTGDPRGVAYMQFTNRAGKRCSAVDAFIRPIMDEPRLTVKTRCKVTKILFNGSEAIGVEYAENGVVHQVRPAAEVILAAGAFVTPQLLMLSGLGAADHLRDHGIGVVADLPGVGENLQDHFEAPVMAETRRNLGYYRQDQGWRMVMNGLEYVLFGRGRVATNGVETCSYMVPDDESGDPIVKIYCVPTTTYKDPDVTGVPDVDGVTLNACLLRPRSRGWVRLRSKNPADAPLINSNFLSHPDDLKYLVAGLRAARDIFATKVMQAEVTREIFPGPSVQSDEELEAHARRTVKTNYHPVGTCRIGHGDDRKAVVSPDLRVIGTSRLRVIDMSVVPTLMSANTNAPAMAIADRAMDLMFG